MDIQLPQILFQIVNFSVVLGALVHLLYKPIQKILDERADQVAESLKKVEEIDLEKEQIKTLKAKTKRVADKEATKVLEEAKQAATKRKQEVTAQTKLAVQEEMKKAQTNWSAEKKQLMADSKRQMVEAVIEVSSMVLGKKLDQKANQKLVDQGLSEALKNI